VFVEVSCSLLESSKRDGIQNRTITNIFKGVESGKKKVWKAMYKQNETIGP